MLKALLFWALLASVLLLVSSTDYEVTASSTSTATSSSSSSSSSASSSSSSSVVTENRDKPICGKNEVFSNCTNGGCYGARNCSEKGRAIKCVKLDPSACLKGCLCKKGYLRNKNGVCVQEKKCETATLTCTKPNEVYEECPATCPYRTCGIDDRLVRCAKPLEVGDSNCPPPACRCASGYFRSSNGDCVTWDECENQSCPKNEVYDACPAKCPFRTCGIDDSLIDCIPSPRVGDPDCPPPSCRCADGFYRNDKGVCVSLEECPKCNNPNEVYDPCPAPCPPQRCDVDESLILCQVPPQLGDPTCQPGCRCEDGFKRNKAGVCIPKELCSKCTGSNEYYDPCPNTCPPQTCESISARYNCPLQSANKTCEGSCRCEPGYYRNKIGDCISTEDCLKCTGPNEFFSCGGACDNVCATLSKQNQTSCPIVNIVCNKMCYCETGYARDENQICVPFADCKALEPICGINEVFSTCTQATCRNQKCSEKGKPVACPRIAEGYCKKGCVCQENYLRAENGTCIPENQCESNPPEPTCGINEVFSTCTQATCRNQKCSEKGKPVACPRIAKGYCKKGCVCQENYLRSENGTCIPENQCESNQTTCGVNEYYSGCANGGCYGPRKCSQIGGPTICVDLIEGGCRGGCLCNKGFLKNDNDVCIPEKECRGNCGQNEIFSNCTQRLCRNELCSQKDKNEACIDVADDNCQKGCVCQTNYLRAANGTCVPEDQCEENPKCGLNEYYDNCPPSCSPQLCDQSIKVECLPSTTVCKPACRCQEGFLRNEKGICVPKNECKVPTSCNGDPNAVPGCGVNCGRLCSNYDSPDPVACILICYVDGCDCKKNYVLDTNTGKCVLPKDCTPECKINEVFSNCTQAECRAVSCKDRNKPIACPLIAEGSCEKGCVCKPNYYRADNGTCVSEDECNGIAPEPTCGINEVFSTCTQATCRNQKCSEKGKPVACPRIAQGYCKKGCVCQENYLRAENGTCIPENQCESNQTTCGVNEYYSGCANGGCYGPRKCSQIGGPTICVDLIKGGCRGGCLCNKGFLKNDNDVCIPEKECRGNCGQNEIFSNCTQRLCRNELCPQKDKNEACIDVADDNCQKGCVCQINYLRAANGTCVPEDQCQENPKCGLNEYYDDCPPSCSPQLCDQSIKVECLPSTTVCKPACRCQEGFLRNEKGICVPKNECKEPTSCNGDPNAVPGCGVNCGRLCSNYDSPDPVACILICYVDGCDCKKNYVLDTNTGKCVLPKDCTPECKINEVFSNCTQAECRAVSCKDRNKPIACPLIAEGSCEKGCVCKPNYYRADNGTCVSEDECNGIAPECKANEVLSNCTQAECRPVSCKDRNRPVACPLIVGNSCERGCVCQPNYYRTEDGICVSEKECNKIQCPGGGFFNTCPPAKCDAEYCPKDRNSPQSCVSTRNCGEPRCTCGFNQKRNRKTGKCVPTADCPPFKCNGPNEEYQACPPVCPGQNCSDYINNSTCPKFGRIGIVVPCEPQCRCKKNYYRNSQGICVKGSQCIKDEPTSCKGDPNAVPGCGVNCGRLCSNYDSPDPVACSEICYVDGCNCKKDYVLDKKTGKCVLPKDCTPECKVNEVFSNCTQAECRAVSCKDRNKPIACSLIAEGSCKKGCVCKPNYYRADNGTCVSEDECNGIECPGGGFFNTCPPAKCDAEYCPKDRNSPQSCVSTRNCGEPRCTCGFNQKRNRKTGKCVPTADCPPFKCNGPNEEYQACPPVCPGQNCSDYINNSTCPKFGRIGIVVPCQPQCRCKKNYYRNSQGICVKGSQCIKTQCGGDPNAVAIEGCGSGCRRTCSNYKQTGPMICPAVCRTGCDCKPGFVYNNNLKKCVRPADCSKNYDDVSDDNKNDNDTQDKNNDADCDSNEEGPAGKIHVIKT